MSITGDVDSCLEEIENMIDNDSFVILDEVDDDQDEGLNSSFNANSENELMEKDNLRENLQSDNDTWSEQLKDQNYISQTELEDGEVHEEITTEVVSQANIPEICESVNSNVDSLKDKEETETEQINPTTGDHPYLNLIDTYELNEEQLTIVNVGDPEDLSKKPLHIISLKSELTKVISDLKSEQQIALDIQTSMKVYTPIICLLTLSTRSADYIVDVISLKDDMSLLTEILVNPRILKIVYTAKDILSYLQQFLHLFVINIFDVEKAAKVALGKTPAGLNSLLKQLYSYEKRGFKTDYRRRPLQNKTKDSVRANTHYMVYMYHYLKNKLLKNHKDHYIEMLNQCRGICKILFSDRKTLLLQNLQRELRDIQNCQNEILEKLFHWRDTIAKEGNKNPDMILTKPPLLKLSMHMPVDENAIFAITDSIDVKDNIDKIIDIINESRGKYKIHDKVFNSKLIKNATSNLNSTKPKVAQKRKINDQTSPNKQMRSQSKLDSGKFTNNGKSSKNKKNGRYASHQNKFIKGNTVKKKGYWRPEPFLKTQQNLVLSQNQNVSHSTSVTENSSGLNPFQGLNINAFNSNVNHSAIGSDNGIGLQFNNFNQRLRLQIPCENPYEEHHNFITSRIKILNPTDIPSHIPFQNISTSVQNDGPFGKYVFQSVMDNNCFNDIGSNGIHELKRTSLIINDERNNFLISNNVRSSRPSFSVNENESNQYDDYNETLNAIDHKINRLEREVTKYRSRSRSPENNFNDEILWTRR